MATSSPTTLYQQFNAANAAYEAATAALGAAERCHSAALPQAPLGAIFFPGDTPETYNARLREEREARERIDEEYRQQLRVDELEAEQERTLAVAGKAYRKLVAARVTSFSDVRMKIAAIMGEAGCGLVEIEDLALVARDIDALLGRVVQ